MKRDADKARRDTSAWSLDQITKSRYFRVKLHEWGLLSVAEAIEKERGENLDWTNIEITERAWNKVIHAGIKPILVFAHPTVLSKIRGSVGYYRMLSMVSQKSMLNVGLSIVAFEIGDKTPDENKAIQIAVHLNTIISNVVEVGEVVTRRELDLWRGMAAGTQAQGSWQNEKGSKFQKRFIKLLEKHIRSTKLVKQTIKGGPIVLVDGRTIVFGSEPDVGIYRDDELESAVEIKGGIDPAGILEWVVLGDGIQFDRCVFHVLCFDRFGSSQPLRVCLSPAVEPARRAAQSLPQSVEPAQTTRSLRSKHANRALSLDSRTFSRRRTHRVSHMCI